MSERLDIIPAQLRVIVIRRLKYACRSCEAGITQAPAPAPAHLIHGGLPTEALIAHALVSKYADHLPLYRQAHIYSRQDIELDRSILENWVGKAALELKLVFEFLLEHLKTFTKLFMDETRALVLDPGRRRTKTGYFWALASDDRPWDGGNPLGVAYNYAPGRVGAYEEKILEGFTGILQVNGNAGYNSLTKLERKGSQIELAYCWAHARRKLHDVAKNSTAPIAEEGLKLIAELYHIEAGIKGMSTEARLTLRRQQSAPRVEALELWLTEQRVRVSKKSPLGETLRYIARFWKRLTVFPRLARQSKNT